MKRPIRVARELPTPQCISLMLWQLGAKQQNIHIQQRLSLLPSWFFVYFISSPLPHTLSLSPSPPVHFLLSLTPLPPLSMSKTM